MHARSTITMVALGLVGLGAGLSWARADVLTLPPTDDTYIAMNAPNQNACSLSDMAVRNRYGYQSAYWEADPLIKFDLSNIPPNATITSATLYLYYFQYGDNNPAGRSLTCYRLLGDWTECVATWNNQPACAAQASAAAVVSAYVGRWMDWDVTADVQAFANGSLANRGWIIKDELPWNSYNIPIARFYSKEFGQLVPYLRIVMAQKLVAPDAAPGDSFGCSVAVDGETALIGAWADDDHGTDSGSAYVFRRSGATWVQEAKLFATDPGAGDAFGWSVAIDGDLAIVGAYKDDTSAADAGSAYVFRRSGQTWAQEAKLVPLDVNDHEYFGHGVAIQGNVAVVGASYDDQQDIRAGAVYVFRYDGSTWHQEAKLLRDNGEGYYGWAYFGCSVAIDGTTIAAGADGAYVGGSRQGEAYIFRWNGSTWSQEARLVAPDGAYLDDFGEDVDIKGDVVVVGAFWDDDNGTDSGSAYVFRHDGSSWTYETKLLASDGAAGDEFGLSVALSDRNNLVVGARYHDGPGADSGAAYRFFYDEPNWSQVSELVPADGAAGDWFGICVAFSGNTVLVGADHDDHAGGIDAGSAYAFRLDLPGDTDGDGVLDFADINPFVLALTDHDAYLAAYPYCDYFSGDLDENGVVDFDDINLFVALLSGGSGEGW